MSIFNQIGFYKNIINESDYYTNYSLNKISKLEKRKKPNYNVDTEVIINCNNNHSEMDLPVLRVIETIIGTIL